MANYNNNISNLNSCNNIRQTYRNNNSQINGIVNRTRNIEIIDRLDLSPQARNNIASMATVALREVREFRQENQDYMRGLDAWGVKIDAWGDKLESHGRDLESHGRDLESHGRDLEAHGQKIEALGKEIAAYKKELQDRIAEKTKLLEQSRALQHNKKPENILPITHTTKLLSETSEERSQRINQELSESLTRIDKVLAQGNEKRRLEKLEQNQALIQQVNSYFNNLRQTIRSMNWYLWN